VREKGRSVDELAQLLSGGDPARALAEAVDGARSPDEREVLQAVGVYGDAPVGQEHLAALLQTPGVAELLETLERRHELKAHSPRYSRAGVLAEEREGPSALSLAHARALRHLTSWAQERRGNFAELMQEAPALLLILRWAVDSEHFREAIALGRAIDEGFAWERRWGAWGRVIETVYVAARRVGDRAAEAWALHQRGTRAVCLGDAGTAVAALEEAVRIRRELGDEEAAKASAHNLAIASRPPTLFWRITHLPFTVLAIVAGVLALGAGGVTAAVLSSGGGGGPGPGPAATSTPAGGGDNQTGGTTPNGENQDGNVRLGVDTQGPGRGSVTSDPPGINCPKQCTATFPSDTEVTLTPKRDEGSIFAGWSGDCSGTEPCRLRLDANRIAVAQFDTTTKTLTVNKAGTQQGNVTSDPEGISCGADCGSTNATFDNGTTVTLFARPLDHAKFIGWSVESCGDARSCAVTLDNDVTITAEFQGPKQTTSTPTEAPPTTSPPTEGAGQPSTIG
jgi:hypothetical protein